MKIDKDIKLPDRKRGRKELYPIMTLEIGDSFLVENIDNSNNAKLQKKLSAICIMRCKMNKKDWKFATRQTSDPLGVRVFRVK